MIDNRQLRVWFLMLYPAYNYNHLFTLYNIYKGMYSHVLDYIFIYHKSKYESGELIKRSHVHIILMIKDQGIRRNTICNYLNLSEDDLHLFKGLDEFKKNNGVRMFKTVDNYIDYCTHINNSNKTDKYSLTDFYTNVPDKVKKAIDKVSFTPAESFNYLVNFVDNTVKNDINSKFWDITTWYMYCQDNGLGDMFFRHWSKITTVLKDYMTFN